MEEDDESLIALLNNTLLANTRSVMPAKAAIQGRDGERKPWIPACAEMTIGERRCELFEWNEDWVWLYGLAAECHPAVDAPDCFDVALAVLANFRHFALAIVRVDF